MTPMKTSKTSPPSKMTEGQEIKYRRLVEDSAKHAAELALRKVKTNEVGWQNVLEHGNDLRKAIAKTVVAKTRRLSVLDQTELFTDEDNLDPFERHGVSRT